MIRGQIFTGDVIWMDRYNELIEIVGFNHGGREILYWGSRAPSQVDTSKCKASTSWIIWEHGVRVGNVRPKRRRK